jgi:hypothetical protein
VTGSALDTVAAMRLDSDGTMRVIFADGRSSAAPLGRDTFEASSSIASSTYFPGLSRLWLQTTRGDNVVLEIPTRLDLAPRAGRPSIYLDQNHWSTLANTIHEPARVANEQERLAAEILIELALGGEVILPLSSAHATETCKQADHEQRYRRALTMAQLSSGWQLRDPLAIRRFEIRQALTVRYSGFCLVPPAVVTLEPNALHADRREPVREVDPGLPEDARWVVHAVSCIGGIIDTLLDGEHLPAPSASGWANELQRFAEFLASNPTGKEMLRRRTHAKFVADLGRELPEEACRAGVSPEDMSDWTLQHSEADLVQMPALGLFREVLHEKLCDPHLQWEGNDLIDMMYLTAGAAYCDHVVAERRHATYITNGFRRLGAKRIAHRNLRSFVEELAA